MCVDGVLLLFRKYSHPILSVASMWIISNFSVYKIFSKTGIKASCFLRYIQVTHPSDELANLCLIAEIWKETGTVKHYLCYVIIGFLLQLTHAR